MAISKISKTRLDLRKLIKAKLPAAGVGLFVVLFLVGIQISQALNSSDLSSIGCIGSGCEKESFNNPNGIAVDSSGNRYIADTYNNRVVKMDSSGNVLWVLGSETLDSYGNPAGGYADGEFDYPQDVAVDSSGNVYVADGNNNRVVKINSSGTVFDNWGALTSESYGEGQPTSGSNPGEFTGPSGVAVDADGYVYVVDRYNNRVQKFNSDGEVQLVFGSSGSWDGEFQYPSDVAVNASGQIFVTDTGNNRVQVFQPNGDYHDQFGENGSNPGQLNSPRGITIDGSGSIYVADAGNARIQKFNTSNEPDSSFGTYGTGEGELAYPGGIALDASGKIYVADTENNRIQVFESNGDFSSQISSQGSSDGEFKQPWGVAIDTDGNIYVVDSFNNRVQKFNSAGEFESKFGSAPDCYSNYGSTTTTSYAPTTTNPLDCFNDGAFLYPAAIAIDNSGNIYVADSGNNRVQKFNSSGEFVSKIGSEQRSDNGGSYGGNNEGEFNDPRGVAVDASGNIYVSDSGNNRVQKFNSAGEFQTLWGNDEGGSYGGSYGGSDEGELNYPMGIAVDSNGNVYVADSGNDRIQKFNTSGGFIDQWGLFISDNYGGGYPSYGSGDGEFSHPAGVAIDSSGNVYVSDTFNSRIQKFTSTGTFLTKYDGSDTDLPISGPAGISTSNFGRVGVAMPNKNQVQMLCDNDVSADGCVSDLTDTGGGSGGGSDGDSDGVPDNTETDGPNGGDGNNDGTPDSEQTNVSTFVDSVSEKYVTIVAPSGVTITGLGSSAESGLSKQDSRRNYPLGFISFTAQTNPGATIAVTVIFHGASTPTNYTPVKFNPNTQTFTVVPNATVTASTIGGQSALSVSYSIADGGTLDADALPNGSIVDPIGLGTSVAPTSNTPGGLLALTGAANVRLIIQAAFILAAIGSVFWSVAYPKRRRADS